MKRYISLVCVALIVVMCMASPVSAAESRSVGYLDLLSLGYINSNGSSNTQMYVNLTGTTSGFFSFPNEFNVALGKFELLVFTNDSNISFTSNSGVVFSKVISSLGSNYYVVTGSFSGSAPRINYTSTGGYLYILTARALPLGYSIAEIPFDFQIYDALDGELLDEQKSIMRYEYEDDPYFTDLENSFSRQIRIYPDKEDLAGLDYFDLDFYIQYLEIDSISASFGGNALDVSYTSSFIGDGIINDSVNSGEVGQDKTYGVYKVVIRVDVSGISMIDGLPTVFITYNANNFYGYQPYVYIYGINAGVVWSETDPVVVTLYSRFSSLISNLSAWFSGVRTAISDQTTLLLGGISDNFLNLDSWIQTQTQILEDAIRGDPSSGDSFQQEVDEKDQQLDDMAAVMDSVDRPELDSVNVSADNYVDSTVLASTMSGITTVVAMPVFMDVIVMSILMATAGYVLFGKR